MKASLWRGKKTMTKWEIDRKRDNHFERLKQARPTSCDPEWEPHVLNQQKKLRLQEDKFTEIERENRYLLQKITTTMNKKSDREEQKPRMHRSLHASLKKKQLETIQVENARLLKRLQDKKSDYDSQRLKQQWKKQKQMMKNIAFYPFTLKSSHYRKKRVLSKTDNYTERTIKNNSSLSTNLEIVRIRKFNNEQFIITVKLDQQKMQIVGDQRKNIEKKIINIPREEALAFIQGQCQGKIENIFDQLSYDPEEDVLYLVGNAGTQKLITIRQKRSQFEEDKASNI